MTQAATKRQEKTIVALTRYFVKATKSVVLDILSGNDQYRVCLNANGTANCTCDGNAVWHKTCRHIKAMQAREASKELATVGAVITAAVETVAAHIEEAAVAGDKTYAQAIGYGSGRPTYGTCGHLSRNGDDECGACKSKLYR